MSALCMLAALWCLVRLVGEPALDWVLAALTFWLAGAALSAGEAWLSHAAEARFSANLRRQAAAHLYPEPRHTPTAAVLFKIHKPFSRDANLSQGLNEGATVPMGSATHVRH